MENKEIKKDFGTVVLKERTTDVRQQVKTFMSENGYNVKECDVCSVKCDESEDGDVVMFKFVHYFTPTMLTEPYYKIEFIYEQ